MRANIFIAPVENNPRIRTKGSSENNSPISPPNFPNLRLFFRQKSFTAAAAAPQDFFSQKKSNLGKI